MWSGAKFTQRDNSDFVDYQVEQASCMQKCYKILFQIKKNMVSVAQLVNFFPMNPQNPGSNHLDTN